MSSEAYDKQDEVPRVGQSGVNLDPEIEEEDQQKGGRYEANAVLIDVEIGQALDVSGVLP